MPDEPSTASNTDALSHIMGLVLGLLFIAGGLWVQHRQAYERATLIDTQGTVVDSVSRQERDDDEISARTTYAPVIEFVVDDQPVRFTGHYESYRISEGQPVLVRYNSDEPATSARVVEPLEGLTAWSMFGMGGIAILTSLWELRPRWGR